MNPKSNIHLSFAVFISFSVAAAALALLPATLRADAPGTAGANFTVLSGVAAISTHGTNSLTITAATHNTILRWNSSLSAGGSAAIDTITFTLPDATSSILVEITETKGTAIARTIKSNGKVYLLSSNGTSTNALGESRAFIDGAGFYTSAVPEDIDYFVAHGTLRAFSTMSPLNDPPGSP